MSALLWFVIGSMFGACCTVLAVSMGAVAARADKEDGE